MSQPPQIPDDAESMEAAIMRDSENLAEKEHLDHSKCCILQVSDLISNQLHVDKEHARQPVEPLHKNNQHLADDPYAYAHPHMIVCGSVQTIRDTYVTVKQHNSECADCAKQPSKKPLWSLDTINIPYTHLIYALGSHMPDPLRRDSVSKQHGVEWMQRNQQRIRESHDVVIIGGGALGVEMACDIASLYKRKGEPKNVTLIHSRKQLLPIFDPRIHEVAYEHLKDLGVNVVLGHRLATAEGCPLGSTVRKVATTDPSNVSKDAMEAVAGSSRQRIRTTLGLELECDLLLMCTGQQPNSEIMAEFSPASVNPSTRLVRVLPSLQVMISEDEEATSQPFSVVPPCVDCDCFLDRKAEGASRTFDENGVIPPHFQNIYAIGDVADAFGALNAGFQAWFMADIAAENILRDILHVKSTTDPENNKLDDSEPVPLTSFKPGPPLLKLALGLHKLVTQGAPEPDESLPGKPIRPTIAVKEDSEDMDIELTWKYMALADPSNMHA
jgi:hypothetical protein